MTQLDTSTGRWWVHDGETWLQCSEPDLLKRVAELEAALKPFAVWLTHGFHSDNGEPSLTIGHFREARRVYTRGKP